MATITDFQKLLFPNDPSEWDGVWGNKCKNALNAIVNPTEFATPPATNHSGPWPKEADAASFYGHSDGSSQWEESHLVSIPVPYPMNMDGTIITKIRCHKLVAPSLSKILSQIRALYPSNDDLHATGLDRYDGCYNYREVRGRSGLSMHAYGAAIDFDAEHNPLGATHGKMPPEVVALFKAEGWRWGGDYQGRKDWMHFEACS